MKIAIDTPLGRIESKELSISIEEGEEFINKIVGKCNYLSIETKIGKALLPEAILGNSIIYLTSKTS